MIEFRESLQKKTAVFYLGKICGQFERQLDNKVIYNCFASAIYRPKVFPDGNAWCALYGENVQEGVCGFGDTPADAVHDFNLRWNGWGKYKKDKS